MLNDPEFIANVVNGIVIAIVLVWVSHAAVKKERKRRFDEDVEKGIKARKSKAASLAQDQQNSSPK